MGVESIGYLEVVGYEALKSLSANIGTFWERTRDLNIGTAVERMLETQSRNGGVAAERMEKDVR